MELFWVVGESSGDRHAARLIEAIKQRKSDWRHSGMIGEQMRSAGCEQVADISEAALMGLAEVARHIPRLLKLRNRLIAEIENRKPNLVILVDFPDFNLNLLKQLRKRFGRSISILYYVSPQVWAWRRGRISFMAKHLDTMAVLFPFEQELYSGRGLETVFFGHPMVGETAPDTTPTELQTLYNMQPGEEAVTLMPGSRSQEIERHLPTMIETMERLRRQKPDTLALLVRANTVDQDTLHPYIAGRPWVHMVENGAPNALSVSRVALIKSGTSTVEASLSGTPFAVMYITSPTTYFLGRLLIRGTRHIAMVNVLAGKRIVPERIQERATPEQLCDDLLRMWDGKTRLKVQHNLKQVADGLGQPGATERLADWVITRFGSEQP